MHRIPEILSRLLLLAAAIVVVLAPAELYLRQRVRLHPPIGRDDPVTLYGLRPDRTVRDTSPGDFSVTYAINRHGFRYRDFEVAKPPGTFRVLGLGDSFTFGVGVEAGETFLARLETHLGRVRRSPVEVVNCGTSGWGTSHVLAFVEHRAFAYDPDLIVVGFFVNDPRDDRGSGLYRLEGGVLAPVPPADRAAALPERTFFTRLPLYDFLARRSAILALLRTRYLDWRERHRVRSVLAAAPQPEDPLELTRLLLRRLRQVTDRHRVPLALLLIPRRWPADAGPEEALAQFADLRRICAAEAIPCLDATPVLLGSGHRLDELYYGVHDEHWKPLAHRLAGDALYEFLAAGVLSDHPALREAAS